MALDPQNASDLFADCAISTAATSVARRLAGRPTIVPNTLKLLVYGPAESPKEYEGYGSLVA